MVRDVANVADLIQNGVIPDGHPAGIQFVLYFLVQISGYDEFIIKLPFLVFGIVSIYLAYRIAEQVFDVSTAIITASLMASLEFFIMYAQMARPYASGLFFSLLLVYFFTRIVTCQKQRWKPEQ